MGRAIQIRYYYHCGFSAVVNRQMLVFDYWNGLNRDIPEEYRISRTALSEYEHAWVFVSNGQADHLDEEILSWKDTGNVTYITASDMAFPLDSCRLSAGESAELAPQLRVKAFPSTDTGVSFWVSCDGWQLFHAGDLNFWHWREESTVKEIEEAETAFRTAMASLAEEKDRLDAAFFPVDPRQGAMFDAGGNYFVMSMKPRVFIPMHFWGRKDLMENFARQSRTRDTQILTLTAPGDELKIEEKDGRYAYQLIRARQTPPRAAATDSAGDPFHLTDLPVDLSE